MANKLKNMRLTSVDLVRNGANQEADICLFKSDDAPEQPTERETNILKRFIHWLLENPADADESPVEKDYTTFGTLTANRENNEKLWQYTSALTESIRSIQDDHELDKEEKLQMMKQSLGEFTAAMETLIEALCSMKSPGNVGKAAPEEEEPEEEEVEKFNPNHGADGRFAPGPGGGGSVAAGTGGAKTSGKPAFGSTKPKFNDNGLAKITVYRGTMGKDWTEQKLTINSGTKRTTEDSVIFEGTDKARNTYSVKYRLGSDGKADYSRCDVIEKAASDDDIEDIEEV